MTEREKFEDLIFKMRCKAVTKFKERTYDEAWKILMNAWDLLPEPKYKQSGGVYDAGKRY